MPLYEYVVTREDGSEGERFEVMQSMQAEPWTKHPETGEPVRRVISRPAPPKVIGGNRQAKPDLSASSSSWGSPSTRRPAAAPAANTKKSPATAPM